MSELDSPQRAQKYFPALFDTILLFHTDVRLALPWQRLGQGAFMWRH